MIGYFKAFLSSLSPWQLEAKTLLSTKAMLFGLTRTLKRKSLKNVAKPFWDKVIFKTPTGSNEMILIFFFHDNIKVLVR